MKKFWMLGAGILSFGLTVLPSFAQEPRQQRGGGADLPGPIDNLGDLQDTARMIFKAADQNNDGQISQKEAVDSANLLVGGFFFRADKNGDGVLSAEEAREAREAFMSTKPWLRYAVGTAKAQLQKDGVAGKSNNQNQNMLATLASTLDSNNDKQLQSAELRQAIQTAVQAGFAAVDTNRDGQVSPAELQASVRGISRQIAQASFQQADTDRDGQISQEEFIKAIEEPARVAFAIADLNHDGKISQEEAQTARQLVMSKLQQLNFPQGGSNSGRNQGNSAFGSPTQPNQQPGQSNQQPAQPPAAPANPR